MHLQANIIRKYNTRKVCPSMCVFSSLKVISNTHRFHTTHMSACVIVAYDRSATYRWCAGTTSLTAVSSCAARCRRAASETQTIQLKCCLHLRAYYNIVFFDTARGRCECVNYDQMAWQSFVLHTHPTHSSYMLLLFFFISSSIYSHSESANALAMGK